MTTTPAGKKPEASQRIAQGVITVLAQDGVGRLTHRRVAAAGALSLSATTYHFATKQDMLAHASRQLLAGYVERFSQIAQECRLGERPPVSLAQLSARILGNAAGKNSVPALAWCEIMLEAARSKSGHAIALDWYEQLEASWIEVGTASGATITSTKLATQIDILVGLLFMTRAAGLDEAQIDALVKGASPRKFWSGSQGASARKTPENKPPTAKAQATRESILQAAIELLIEGGIGAVTYAGVAKGSGQSLTAPAYHFGSISGLLKQAQSALFAASKTRYRTVLATQPSTISTPAMLADITAAIFIREATQFSRQSTAYYSIWLEAARDEELRPDVASAIIDQAEAWQRRLSGLFPASMQDALTCQALFVGALVRALASGAPTANLAQLRAQFTFLFEAICARDDGSTLFQI